MRIFGIVLAGGQGRRMGGADKALLELAGKPLIARVIARAEPQVEDLAISANGDPSRLARFDLPVLADSAQLGPLAGVLSGLKRARTLGATAVVSFAVDTPFFPGDLVPRLCLAAEASPAGLSYVRAIGRDHPTFALWPVEMTEMLDRFLASGQSPRLRDFLTSHAATPADFADDVAFENLNTAEDLAKAEALLQGDGR